MISKIIHYCWFGAKEIPELANRCIKSWEKYFPDWEIVLWNESNSPMEIPYMKNAYKNKKWSNLSNYTRLYALKEFGGIYFDTDIEVIKQFDFLDKYECFVGFESEPLSISLSINNAVLGACKQHFFINECLREIELKYDGTEIANLSSPVLTTNVLLANGLDVYGDQDLNGIHIFDMKAFYPYAWYDIFTFSCITKDTYTIHYWDMSWKDKEAETKDLLFARKALTDRISFLESQSVEGNSRKVNIKNWIKLNLRFVKSIFK